MHAVINHIRLSEPLDDDVYAAARREIPERVAAIDGIRAVYLVRNGDDGLTVVILGDSEAAIEQMRTEVGNEWMRTNVIPHAAAPPDRTLGEIVTAYERG